MRSHSYVNGSHIRASSDSALRRLLSGLMESGSRGVGLKNDRIFPKFDKIIDCTAAKAPVKIS